MMKVEPMPGVLSTVTSPPSMVQKCLVMASPRPVPPKRLVVEASAWLNAWNSLPSCSWRHADAGVGHAEGDPRTVLPRYRQGQRALAGELVGVAHQVEQACFTLVWSERKLPISAGQIDLERHSRSSRRAA